LLLSCTRPPGPELIALLVGWFDTQLRKPGKARNTMPTTRADTASGAVSTMPRLECTTPLMPLLSDCREAASHAGDPAARLAAPGSCLARPGEPPPAP
jgi:hypothetical protein